MICNTEQQILGDPESSAGRNGMSGGMSKTRKSFSKNTPKKNPARDSSSVASDQQFEFLHAVRYANRHKYNHVAYLPHAGCNYEKFIATKLK
jgi:hypothetical protein